MEALMKKDVCKCLPGWIESRHMQSWLGWIEKRVKACVDRARTAGAKECSREAWRRAIVESFPDDGRYHYSRFPIRTPDGDNTHAMSPSIDHCQGVTTLDLVIESRLVNDMKTILSEKEFKEIVGHLCCTLKARPGKREDNWECTRNFARGKKV